MKNKIITAITILVIFVSQFSYLLVTYGDNYIEEKQLIWVALLFWGAYIGETQKFLVMMLIVIIPLALKGEK